MVVLYFCIALCLVLCILPFSWLEMLQEHRIIERVMDTEIKRGQRLLSWMDSLGLGEVGFNLKVKLPERDCFRHYGNLIHELWDEVREKGGSLGPLLKLLRKELRAELLRVKKENEFLKGAYVQVLMMVSLVLSYLIVFSLMIEIPFPRSFWLTLFLYESFGVLIFIYLLKKFRSLHFDPLKDLTLALMNLKSISLRGRLGDFALSCHPHLQKGPSLEFFHRLESTLEQWKRDSRIQTEYLIELEEDLEFLRNLGLERFMAQLRILSFMWSLVFVLPVLFGASLFGLYELTVV